MAGRSHPQTICMVARDRFDMGRLIPLEAKAPQPICEVRQRLHARIIVPAK